MSTPPANANVEPAMRLLKVFYSCEKSFSRWAQSIIDGGSSSPAQLRLLGALTCGGSQIMSNLSGELGVTPRQVTNLVDALEAEGLVRRVAHPTDRRATVVEVTPAGAEYTEQLWQPYCEKMAGLFRELPEDDCHELLRLLEVLLLALKRRSAE